MTRSEEDIVLRLLAIARDMGASFTEEQALQIECKIKQEVGGQRIYVQKSPARLKTQRLAAAIRTGKTISEAMAMAGVHKAWGYALMSRKAR